MQHSDCSKKRRGAAHRGADCARPAEVRRATVLGTVFRDEGYVFVMRRADFSDRVMLRRRVNGTRRLRRSQVAEHTRGRHRSFERKEKGHEQQQPNLGLQHDLTRVSQPLEWASPSSVPSLAGANEVVTTRDQDERARCASSPRIPQRELVLGVLQRARNAFNCRRSFCSEATRNLTRVSCSSTSASAWLHSHFDINPRGGRQLTDPHASLLLTP